jgi:hypothetical protein
MLFPSIHFWQTKAYAGPSGATCATCNCRTAR